MSNPYTIYYKNQAGSGIAGYQGVRFQKGGGFFGNIFRSALLPVLKYFGKQAINTGVDIASDAIEGENVLDSFKKRGKMAARSIANDVALRANRYAQTGKGRKRKIPQIGEGKRKRRRKSIKKLNKKNVISKRSKAVRRKGRKRSKKVSKVPSIFL